MIRHIIDSRLYLTLILTVGIGTVLIQHFPFPDDNAVLQLVAAEKPVIFLGIKGASIFSSSKPFRAIQHYCHGCTWRPYRGLSQRGHLAISFNSL